MISPVARDRLDLSGTWMYRLDRDGVGEAQQWFAGVLQRSDAQAETGELSLPGSLQHQGIGDPVTVETPWTGGIVDRSFFTDERYAPYRQNDDVSVPFWLQPRVYFRGAAWFQREIEVPREWDGDMSVLELERVHWESTVWVDHRRIGTRNSLTTAHRYELGRLRPGTHLLTIRVDNRTVIDVGPNAHAVSDHTQGNWNGLIGRMELLRRGDIGLSRVRVFPDVDRRSARVQVDVVSGTAGVREGRIRLTAHRIDAPGHPELDPITAVFSVDHGEDLGSRGLSGGGTHLDVELALGDDAATWDEFDPALYELRTELWARTDAREHHDATRTVFGLREVATDGTQVTVNGRPTFIRGSLECCVFPLTGYPPMDLESWRRLVAIAKDHGLNLLRMHSWCPPEAAFLAADEAGLYLQVEGPIWANQGAALGEGRAVDAFIHDETRRILREYGNHPSFIMMAHGNEPGGRDAEFLASWVQMWRSQDPRRLYTSGAGWPVIAENDFDNVPEPRAHRWGEGLASRLNSEPPNTLGDYADWVSSRPRPIISHEIGQWCAYPDLDEPARYTGLMQARNFEIFADLLEESGMADQARAFLAASGSLQALCYKEEIESALRTEGFGGFHLLGLTDFPGQGTALVGVLNAFWESKGYCSADQFARFCGPTVPLARLVRRMWEAHEPQDVGIQIAHFGSEPLEADVSWSLRDRDGRTVATEVVARAARIEIGNATRLGPIEIPAGLVREPTQLSFAITLDGRSGARFENDWDVWIYPELPAASPVAGIRVTCEPHEAIAAAEAGETVLLDVIPERLRNGIDLGFTPVFWNTAWTRGQSPHTLGLLHDPSHPVFDGFPSDGATNWQWWPALRGARPILLDGLPDDLRPVVQVIDTCFEARRLGVLLEARLGRGRLMVSSLNLSDGEGDDRLAARQLRRSVLEYMSGAGFEPRTTIGGEQLLTALHLNQYDSGSEAGS